MSNLDINKVTSITSEGKKLENVEIVFIGCDIEDGINITFIDKRDIDYKFNTENLETEDFDDCIEVVYDKETCRTYTILPDRGNGFDVICKFMRISDEERDVIESESGWVVQKKAEIVFKFISELYNLPKMTIHRAVVEDEWRVSDVTINEAMVEEGGIDGGFCGVNIDDGNLLLEFTEHGTGEVYYFDFNDIRSFEGAVKEFTPFLDGVDDPEAPIESKDQIMQVLFSIDSRREIFHQVASDLIACAPHQVHGSYTCEGYLLLECTGH